MRITVGAASDIGQVREGNEDSFLVLDPLFAVADGMGGHRGGEVASNLALETIERLFSANEGSLTEQVELANRAVFERSQADREVSGMGTTLTAVVVRDAEARLAHVGDSRAYLLRGGELHLLTKDHTLVHRMVEEGEITEEEAETHPHRSILTRALGVDGGVQVDEGIVELRDGDRLLLCTDGLTGMVSDAQIKVLLEETRDPQEAAKRLVTAANRAGGVDNITAVILDVADDGPGGGTDRAATADPTATSRAVSTATPVEPADVMVSPRAVPLAPPAKGRGRVRAARRIGVGAGIAVAVAVVGIVALRFYLDTQWFVGVSDGRVAIFRGLPAEVAGFDLNSVVIETTIPAEEAEALEVYRETLPEGITADDREGAEDIVEQIRVDVARAQATGS
ncbi:MAG: Stp1/IreP family PP2C-type Ser/Thr phosphatase [Actinomycetota bacterium]